MIVVSDTSPVSNLILIERLDILSSLYNEVVVPTAVDKEIRDLGRLGYDLVGYTSAKWIRVLEPSDLAKVQDLKFRLDDGEAEAIALAIEINCDLLLMDERIGTKIARSEGLRTVGLVGLLIKAKHDGFVPDVRSLLDQLRSKAGFWIGEALEKRVLEAAGELDQV